MATITASRTPAQSASAQAGKRPPIKIFPAKGSKSVLNK